MKDILEQLRKAIDKALKRGWSISSIAKSAGITRTTLQQWHRETRPSMDAKAVALLAKWLGSELTPPVIPKPPETRKPTRKGVK
jgi:transcriptional regulator with XRE-family HTH domain